jgi:hypothetical protein
MRIRGSIHRLVMTLCDANTVKTVTELFVQPLPAVKDERVRRAW